MALLEADITCHALETDILPSLMEKVNEFGSVTGFGDQYVIHKKDVTNKFEELEELMKTSRARLVQFDWDVKKEWRLEGKSFQKQHYWARAIRDEYQRIANHDNPHCNMTEVMLAVAALKEYRGSGENIPIFVDYVLQRRREAGLCTLVKYLGAYVPRCLPFYYDWETLEQHGISFCWLLGSCS